MRVTCALLLAGALVGCSTIHVDSYDRQGESYDATSPGEVVLFESEAAVDRPFRTIGGLQWYGKRAEPGEVDAALREEAARIGAHGVIRIDNRITVEGPFSWPIEYHSGFAEAIRFGD